MAAIEFLRGAKRSLNAEFLKGAGFLTSGLRVGEDVAMAGIEFLRGTTGSAAGDVVQSEAL
jgi:hypothetical protein